MMPNRCSMLTSDWAANSVCCLSPVLVRPITRPYPTSVSGGAFWRVAMSFTRVGTVLPAGVGSLLAPALCASIATPSVLASAHAVAVRSTIPRGPMMVIRSSEHLVQHTNQPAGAEAVVDQAIADVLDAKE